MGTSIRPPRFNREAARAAGMSDADIDAYLSSPEAQADSMRVAQGGAFSSESTGTRATLRNASPEQAAGNRAKNLTDAISMARQIANGATFNAAPKIKAGVRAGLGSGSYSDNLKQIDEQNAAFSEEHPIASVGGQILGGIATGGLLLKGAQSAGAVARAIRASQLVPKVEGTAGAGARAWAAAKAGGVAGGLTGAGSSRKESVGDFAKDVAVGSGFGAGGGAALSGITDVVRRARQVLASAGQPGSTGPVRRFAQSAGGSPETAAAQKVAQTMGRGGTTLDDLKSLSAQAEAPTSLAELIGDDQGIRSLRVARNLGRNREQIDRSLAERAAGEPSRFAEVIARETGVPEGLDGKVVAEQARAAVEPRVSALYAKAYQRPNVASEPVLKSMTKLAQMKRGRAALERAGELSSGFDALQLVDEQSPAISVQNLHYLRQGVDYALDRAVEEGDAQMVRILSTERATLDRAFKQAAGKVGRRADQLWERAAAEGESFAAGQRSQLAKTNQGINAAKSSARDPKAFRRGAASKQLETIESTPDGTTGAVRNPTRATMEHGTARARARLGYSDPQSFDRVERASNGINARLRTKNAVSGGSTTAANIAEMADFAAPEEAVKKLMTGNVSGAIGSATDGLWRGLTRGDNAAVADQMSRILAAGLPKQMSREEAIRRMEEILPAMVNIYRRNGAIQGQAAGAFGGRGPRR
jgi:hypothetical protein